MWAAVTFGAACVTLTSALTPASYCCCSNSRTAFSYSARTSVLTRTSSRIVKPVASCWMSTRAGCKTEAAACLATLGCVDGVEHAATVTQSATIPARRSANGVSLRSCIRDSCGYGDRARWCDIARLLCACDVGWRCARLRRHAVDHGD